MSSDALLCLTLCASWPGSPAGHGPAVGGRGQTPHPPEHRLHRSNAWSSCCFSGVSKACRRLSRACSPACKSSRFKRDSRPALTRSSSLQPRWLAWWLCSTSGAVSLSSGNGMAIGLAFIGGSRWGLGLDERQRSNALFASLHHVYGETFSLHFLSANRGMITVRLQQHLRAAPRPYRGR